MSPGTALKALAGLSSSGAQYFWGSREECVFGSWEQEDSVGIRKSEFQE